MIVDVHGRAEQGNSFGYMGVRAVTVAVSAIGATPARPACPWSGAADVRPGQALSADWDHHAFASDESLVSTQPKCRRCVPGLKQTFRSASGQPQVRTRPSSQTPR